MLFLNAINSFLVFFFAALLVWLPASSVMAAQEKEYLEMASKTGRRDMDENADLAITARVKTAISEEPSLRDEEIGVETSQGNVRLTGRVSSILVMEKAIEVAREVQGVRAVKDEMQFKWQY
jgi:osmotically-inducible protein OsmY